MLVLGLGLPIANDKATENFLDLVTDLDFGTVTDEHVHGTIAPNFVFKDIDELSISLHRIEADVLGVTTNKDLGALVASPY